MTEFQVLTVGVHVLSVLSVTVTVIEYVCVVATELALVQCFAIRFLTNPKTIMQS